MPIPKTQDVQVTRVARQFDSDYEHSLKLARLINPSVLPYRESLADAPKQVETITTYGIQVTTF